MTTWEFAAPGLGIAAALVVAKGIGAPGLGTGEGIAPANLDARAPDLATSPGRRGAADPGPIRGRSHATVPALRAAEDPSQSLRQSRAARQSQGAEAMVIRVGHSGAGAQPTEAILSILPGERSQNFSIWLVLAFSFSIRITKAFFTA